MRTLVRSLLLVGVWIPQAWAEAGSDAYTAFRAGAFSRAVEISTPAANAGDFMAQLVMGMAFKDGKGAVRDKGQALEWFDKALAQIKPSADAGDARAQAALGLAYAEGLGVEQDMRSALPWLRKSANAGYPIAQNRLGELYSYGLQDQGGELFSRDRAEPNEALSWYRKAAEQGFGPALINLAEYYGSHGAIPDADKEAFAWYSKAAGLGYASAQLAMGRIYFHGSFGQTEDYKAAVSWYKKAADQGLPEAYSKLGDMYQNGWGVEKSKARSVEWYCKAAESSSMAASSCRAGTEAKAKAEATAKRDKELAPRRAEVSRTKGGRKFNSYGEAKAFFKGTLWLDEQWSLDMENGDKFDRLVYVNPLRYQGTGKVIETLLVINQVVNKNTLMMKPFIVDAGTVPGFYGVISDNFLGPKSFSDNKPYSVIAEVVGETRYVDRRGFARKVPKLFLYAIAPYE